MSASDSDSEGPPHFEGPPHYVLVEELQLACDEDDIPRIKRLFATTSLDSDDANKVFTPRHSIQTLQCLLEHGANANGFVSSRYAPSLEALKILARFGYDVKGRGHLILQDYADSRETLDWLLDQGADITKTDENRTDCSPYSLGGQKDYSLKVLSNVAAEGDIELFDHLVSRGADPHRSHALHAVSKCKDPEKARAMIDHLLDKHHMDIECDSLDLQKIMFLHETGKPVHRAVYSRNLDVLQHLLLRGADPESGMEVAIGNCIYSNNFLPALGPLLQAGADPNRALSQAIRQKDIEAARICLDHGAEVMLAIEEQRARAVRVRARREAEMNNRPDESDPDGVYYDSHSSQEDEDEIKERKEIEEFLRSVQGAR